MELRLDVYHHIDQGGSDSLEAKIDQILSMLTEMGEQMSALSNAVDALVQRVTEDTDHLLQLLSEANARAEEAAANDAADAATIADLQAQNQAAMEDAQATIDRLTSIDPVGDFPAVPPDEGEPPVNPDDVPHPDQTLPGDLPPDEAPPQ